MASNATPHPPASAGGHRGEDAEGIGPPTGLLGDYPALHALERWIAIAPALVLFAMMALTFANVFMRYLFRAPISGALEILSYMMGLLVFLCLPLVTARSEHVRISVFDRFMPARIRQLRGVLFNLLMAAMAAMLGWRMWLFADRLEGWGEKTQQYGLPLWTLAQMFAFSCAVMALLFGLTALRAARSRDFVNRMDI